MVKLVLIIFPKGDLFFVKPPPKALSFFFPWRLLAILWRDDCIITRKKNKKTHFLHHFLRLENPNKNRNFERVGAIHLFVSIYIVFFCMKVDIVSKCIKCIKILNKISEDFSGSKKHTKKSCTQNIQGFIPTLTF